MAAAMAAAGGEGEHDISKELETGLDTSMFVDTVPDDLICAICQGAVIDPHVTEECGHLFCRTCIFRGLQDQQSCPLCRCPVHADQLRRDLRAQRQVQRLRVRCKNACQGCDWDGALSDLGEHLRRCQFRAVACPFAVHGCEATIAANEMFEHEQTHMQAHLSLVCTALDATRRRCAELEQQQPAFAHTIAALREELKTMRQQMRQRDSEAVAARASQDAELTQLRRELNEMRQHMGARGNGIARRPSLASLRWDASRSRGKFEVSADGTRARHVTPGWASLHCIGGVSRGAHVWHIRVDPAADKCPLNPSTVMLGITSSTALGSHLGTTPGAWCYQLNGFRWDGKECFAYGSQKEENVANDVISIVLDLDRGELEFLRNGESLGVAFDDVGGLVSPAVSLCTEGHSVTLLMDPPQGSATRAIRPGH